MVPYPCRGRYTALALLPQLPGYRRVRVLAAAAGSWCEKSRTGGRAGAVTPSLCGARCRNGWRLIAEFSGKIH
jgi:hypothetical protein